MLKSLSKSIRRGIIQTYYPNPVMERKISDDMFNDHKNGEITIKLLENKTKLEIGFVTFRPYSGQIGYLFITNPFYANLGYGTKLLNVAINEMREIGTKEVWAVTRDNHEYWSNLRGFEARSPAHPSVGGNGYFMDLLINKDSR